MTMPKQEQQQSVKQSVKVSIMQREFTVACGNEETEGLVEAAAYLDKQMRAVAKGSQILTIDRCAIMAGLNITHSLLQIQKAVGAQENVDSRLQSLHDQIDKAVTDSQQVVS
ncbi:cell division protein ZapA [Candidatus Spongiihabitans sp.]|uniref:cell division protein ZapA n=1 Tax=Candidatus Spongiihabitans sp. TaxID=3101308 RepID=UPI003C6F1D8B